MKIEILESGFIFPLDFEPAPSCHASTIVKMRDGRLAAAWFGGTNESNPDVRIWFSVKNPGGWDRPTPLTPDDSIADWNPVLYSDAGTGRLTLFYKSGVSPRLWRTMSVFSDDCGESWSAPAELVPGDDLPRGPVKNKITVLSSGRLVAPASDESGDGRWAVFFDLSDDGGKTWARTGHLPVVSAKGAADAVTYEMLAPKAQGLIQPTVWEHPAGSGKLSMFARSSFGRVYRADSEDFGSAWSPAYPTDLPNNNSGLDAVMDSEGRLALIYNPVEKNWGNRWPITLAISSDNGGSFPCSIDLDAEPGEYSYPAIIAGDGFLYMTYTFKRRTVKFVKARIV